MAYNVTDREMRRILSLPPAEIVSETLRLARDASRYGVSDARGKDFPMSTAAFDDWAREIGAQAIAAGAVQRLSKQKAAA